MMEAFGYGACSFCGMSGEWTKIHDPREGGSPHLVCDSCCPAIALLKEELADEKDYIRILEQAAMQPAV